MKLTRMTPEDFKTKREAMGYSQSQLADILDVARDTVKRWESGRDPIPYRVAGELATIAERRIMDIAQVADGGSQTRELYGFELTASMSVKTGDGYAPIVGIVQTFRDPSHLILDGWDVTVMAGGVADVIHLGKDETIQVALQFGSFPAGETITQVIETARKQGMTQPLIDMIRRGIRSELDAQVALESMRVLES